VLVVISQGGEVEVLVDVMIGEMREEMIDGMIGTGTMTEIEVELMIGTGNGGMMIEIMIVIKDEKLMKLNESNKLSR